MTMAFSLIFWKYLYQVFQGMSENEKDNHKLKVHKSNHKSILVKILRYFGHVKT